jgi:hypothetical protein
MFYDFRVTNEGKAYSGPVSIEGDTLEDAYGAAMFLYPCEDGWDVQSTGGFSHFPSPSPSTNWA